MSNLAFAETNQQVATLSRDQFQLHLIGGQKVRQNAFPIRRKYTSPEHKSSTFTIKCMISFFVNKDLRLLNLRTLN